MIAKGVDGAPWPVVNVYYDNAGKVPIKGVVVRYGAGISSGRMTEKQIEDAQNNLLRWDGWGDAVLRRSDYFMYPGDSGEFTTIPPEANSLSKDFTDSFADIQSGKAMLYVFIAFKYRTPEMKNNQYGVTEDCFWFSGGNFARHDCGRGRSFVQ